MTYDPKNQPIDQLIKDTLMEVQGMMEDPTCNHTEQVGTKQLVDLCIERLQNRKKPL